MYQVGRLCVKLAGRDARKKCVVIEVIDDNFVMIDGQTRRKKCNIRHLEPLDKVLKVKKAASHKEVVDALKKEKIKVVDPKTKKTIQKPIKLRKSKKKVVKVKEKSKPAKEKKVVNPTVDKTKDKQGLSGHRNSKGISSESTVKKDSKEKK